MKSAFKFLIVATAVFLLLCLLITCIYGHKITVLFLIQSIGETNRTDKILNLVSIDKFRMLQLSLFIFSLLLLVFAVFMNKIWNFIAACLSYIQKNSYALYVDFISTEIKWILLLPFISSIFFAVYMPVSYDEAWTYLQFTSKSPISSLCYYPAPNNHVLHSLITNGTRYIPFLTPLLCLRISSIVVSFITGLLCFSFVKKYYSTNIALFITGVSNMLFMSVYYSYMSRGYGLITFFFILSMYAAFNIIYKGDKIKYWMCFAISNLLGFFTMPSFLYAFVILNVIILINNRLNIKKQFVFNLITLFGVALLYTPIIILNGADAIINNRFVVPISRLEVLDQIMFFISQTITDIFGFNYLVVLAALFISVCLLIKYRMMFELKLAVVFVIFPFLLLIVHSVIPFSRTFNYYGFVLVFLIGVPYFKLAEKISAAYILCITLLIQVCFFVNFYLNIKEHEEFNVTYHEINNQIVGNHSYFFSTVLFETNFMFENETKGYSMSKAEFHFPQIDVDADTLTGFDYYIIDKKYDFTKHKKAAYSDSRTNVYTR